MAHAAPLRPEDLEQPFPGLSRFARPATPLNPQLGASGVPSSNTPGSCFPTALRLHLHLCPDHPGRPRVQILA